MKNLHSKLVKTKSAFAEVSVAAIIIWIGDILCVVADLGWLLGDMNVQVHPHHYYVGALLLVALLLITGSGIWLYRGLHRYMEKHERIRCSRVIDRNMKRKRKTS